MATNRLSNLSKLSQVAKMVINPNPPPPDTFLAIAKIFTKAQVRTKFRNLAELAESFKLNGIIEPLIVHEEPDGTYRLIVGERRLRAAPLAGLIDVPVLIKRGLTELQIRAIQVAENNDREDLTAFEVATGVIEDVTAFGVAEAMKIWNRSEGWISKRVAVKRYLPLTLRMLSEELSGDLEILSVLNQIEEISPEEVQRYYTHLADDKPLPRDEIRNKLNLMRQQKIEAAEYELKRDEEIAQSIANSPLSLDVEEDGQPESRGNDIASAIAEKELKKSADALLKATPEGKKSSLPEKPKMAVKKNVEKDTVEERRNQEAQLHQSRIDAIEWGDGNRLMFAGLQDKFRLLNYKPDEGEFILWSCFLDSVLPLLDSLGVERSKAYLSRLQSELKKKTVISLFNELHGTEDLKELSSSVTVPVMPEDWKF